MFTRLVLKQSKQQLYRQTHMLRVAASMQQAPCRSFGLFDNIFGGKKEEAAKPKEDQKQQQDEQKESSSATREQEFDQQQQTTQNDAAYDQNASFEQEQEYEDMDAASQDEEIDQQEIEESEDVVPELRDMTMPEKLSYVKQNQDGSVTHMILVDSKTKEPLQWENNQKFEQWLSKRHYTRQMSLRSRLTPHEIYVTQGKGNERAFTGEYWWVQDVGIYSCKVCTQNLFLSNHKYQNKSGYATFWGTLKEAVKMRNDHLNPPKVTNAHEDPTLKYKIPDHRAVCSHCEAHLGQIYHDGPQPYNLRFQINSAAVHFNKKPWFEKPLDKKLYENIIVSRKESARGNEEMQALYDDEELLGIGPYWERKGDKTKQILHQAEREPVQFDVKGSQAAEADIM